MPGQGIRAFRGVRAGFPLGSGRSCYERPTLPAQRWNRLPARMQQGDGTMSFALFLIGLALVMGGVAWAMVTAGIAPLYVGITCLVVLGVGIMAAVSKTRTKD